MSSERGVPLSALCPKFLHTNSTSHTWPFSAIAELIDNGYDPDVNAKQFWIDKTQIKGEDCLIFMDNGNGLNYEKMLKMLSFGYSDKEPVNGVLPIGIYGNGFKSGSMRLGSDAIVFSKSEDAMCVGMLSQSYLKEIEAKQIIVPIVSFNKATPNYVVEDEHEASLQDILRYSPFKTELELITEILAISSTPMGSTGTRIIIWNLRKTTSGKAEFDFETDRYNIRIPTEVYEETIEKDKQDSLASSIPETEFSLRAYCSILYLKPRMQIIIRSQKVKTQLISKSLAFIAKDHYRPNFLNNGFNTVHVPITFGYNTKSKDQYGIMMYHKNRLIKPYERVGCQLKANNKGVGVIGVVECNFLDPTHNKQDFLNTDNYRKTMNNLGIKLEEYWKEVAHKRRTEDPGSLPVEDTKKRPDQNWVQCDDCLRWRKLPDGVDCNKLPEKWFCNKNPDPQFRTCEAPQELEDSDDEQPYQKTFRKQEREDKRKQKEKKEEQLRRTLLKEEQLRRKILHQQTSEVLVHTPSSRATHFGGAAISPRCSSKLSQDACSPSTSSSLPVISGVRSLATMSTIHPPRSRAKRAQHLTPASESKRPRFNTSISQTSSAEESSRDSASVKDEDCVDISDDDDDVIIVYDDADASTSVPKKSDFDVSKVKMEQCSDTGMISTETAAVGTGPSPPPPPDHASTTTQTQPPGVKVKEEEETVKQEEDVTKCVREGSEQTEEAASSPSLLAAVEPPALDIDNMSAAQRQQDELMELMQVTAQERDSLRDQVQQLTQQLSDMEKRLQLSKTTVNKECKDQASQSEPTEDYRRLHEQVKREVAELRRENEALLAARLSNDSNASAEQQAEQKPSDEILSQIQALMQQVEERTRERDDLNSKLVEQEEQCVNLVVQSQLLELKLEQKDANPEEGPSTEQSTACVPGTSREAERSGGAEHSSTGSGSDQTKRFVKLRHNIGRLLVPFHPDTDFSQIDYETDVIDGLLDKFLQDTEK